jgi:uncharacterized LabA/DUF88 family protein
MTNNKLLLLIDGANLHGAAKALGFSIDFRKLLSEFRTRGDLLRANFYTALADDDESSPIVPLIDWLDYNGFSVITKPMKSFTDAHGNRKISGDMDVEIAVDAMEMAQHVGHIVLFSGDGDFCPVVQAVQRRGVKVSVVSSVAARPPICADELRRLADEFIDLVDLRTKIARESRAPREVASPSVEGSIAGRQRAGA